MLVDKKDLGFGSRSWRYSMLVRDGVIEKMFIESETPGDPYEVSDADTMLTYIAPSSAIPPSVTIFTRTGCVHCTRAKSLLDRAGLEYEELVLNRDYTDRTLRAVTGATTFPQVFVDGERVGGADELETWLGPRRAA
jgi:glutaredoxin-like protein